MNEEKISITIISLFIILAYIFLMGTFNPTSAKPDVVSDYEFITKWGVAGNKASEFYMPGNISLDYDGYVYISDFGNNRIQKFDFNGNFITMWGTKGDKDGQFHWPMGITVDLEKNIYVADTYNNRIQKFASNGKFIKKWGVRGDYAGYFNEPAVITSDKDGFIYVIDYDSRIQKFTSDGEFIPLKFFYNYKLFYVYRRPGLVVNDKGIIFYYTEKHR